MQLLLPLLLPLLLCGGASCLRLQPQCERIKHDMCKDIGYEWTMPTNNEHMLVSFEPLINFKCSSSLRFFLCSALVPMCDSKWRQPIGPCRPLCQRVRARCLPIMQHFGFQWPRVLNCSQFPARSRVGSEMCMEGSLEAEERPGDTFQQRLRAYRRVLASGHAPPDCGHLRRPAQYVYVNHTRSCALSCHGDGLFSADDKRLAEVWMAVLAALCCLSCLATILAFLADRSRFRYPLRPVVMMAVCYLCYSVSFFVRLLAGRERAACDAEPASGRLVLTSAGLDNANCAVVFLLQYFFGTAAAAWFAVLVVTWLLQAACKWSPEAVAKRSCCFHLPAWALPVGLTVCVLIARRVEADELFGLCGVGGRSSGMLVTFVIAPRLLLLLLQAVCLAVGFVSMWRVRRHVRRHAATTKFDVLTCKIGLFSAMYMLPAGCVCGVHLYEYWGADSWRVPHSPHSPSVVLLLLRCFASLAIGVTTVLWICSCKTLESWRSCLLPGRRQPGRKEAADRVHLRPAGAWTKAAASLQYQPQAPAVRHWSTQSSGR